MWIVKLVIEIVAGIIGGNIIGAGMKNASLGSIGNTIAGAIGGLGGGQLLGALAPTMTNAANGPDIASIIGQLAGGATGGALLTVAVGLIKNALAGKKM